MDERDSEGPDTDTAAAISVVAHEIRLDVLRALWNAENHSLRFSELRRAVGVRDTGKFNYRLSKLEGQFLAHVDDRYELLYPGHRVIDAVRSGVFAEEVEDRSVPLPETCPDCDAALSRQLRPVAGGRHRRAGPTHRRCFARRSPTG